MMQSTELDLGPLTWVKGEIDQALAKAQACLGEAQTSGEPSTQLQFAQTHVHQVCGALAIVGLDAVARFATSLERLLGAMSRNEQAIIEDGAFSLASRAIAAIGNYLEDVARSEVDQPLRLSRLFCEIESARGVELANPAELFNAELIDKPKLSVSDITDDKRRWNAARRARTQFESGLLQWLKNPTDKAGAQTMAQASALACALQSNPGNATFWWTSQAFLQAIANQSLPANALVRRVCTQLGRELRRFATDHAQNTSEHLLRDVLYWLSQVTPTTHQQQQVQHAWRLDRFTPSPDSQVREQPLAPLVKALLQDVGAAKEEWDHFSEGQAAALPAFQHKLESAIGHCIELGRPTLNALFSAIAEFGDKLRADLIKFEKIAGIEVASALLLCEMLLDKSMPEKEFQTQASNTIARLQALAKGETPTAGTEPPASNAAKKLGERQARIQVAREILSGLAQIEQTLDDFFRDQTKQAPLRELAGPLRQIQGALSLLDDTSATELIEQAADTIASLANAEMPDTALFEPLAHQLSALGMYVDALQHGATNIQRFLGGNDIPEQELTEIPAPASFAATPESTHEPVTPPASADSASMLPAASQTSSKTSAGGDDDIDTELLEIFMEEAADVVSTIKSELPQLASNTESLEALTSIRRGFHTLKGSGRMVGLIELSNAAKEVEQTLNLWLQLERTPDQDLFDLIANATDLIDEWVEQISNGGSHSFDAGAVVQKAEQLRHEPEAQSTVQDTSPEGAPSAIEADSVAAAGTRQAQDVTPASDTHDSYPEPVIEEDIETLDFADFELHDFDSGSLHDVKRQTPSEMPGSDSVKIEESFMSTVIHLDQQIFSDEEDPTLRITALDAEPFNFGEFDDNPPQWEETADTPVSEASTPAETYEPALPNSNTSDDQAIEFDLDDDIDIEALSDTVPQEDWELNAESLDGPEVQAFDFGDLSLDLDLSDEAGALDNDTTSAEADVPLQSEDNPAHTSTAPSDDSLILLETAEHELVESASRQHLSSEKPPSIEMAPATSEDDLQPEPFGNEHSSHHTEADVMMIGDIEVSNGLFGLFSVEAGQHLALLDAECQAFKDESGQIPSEQAHRAAHTLAGISATTRIEAMHTLARALEHALQRLCDHVTPPDDTESTIISQSVATLASMLEFAKVRTMPLAEPVLEEMLETVGKSANKPSAFTRTDANTLQIEAADSEFDDLALESISELEETPDGVDQALQSEALPSPDENPEPAGLTASETGLSSQESDTIAISSDEIAQASPTPALAPTQAPAFTPPSAAPKVDTGTVLKDDLDPQLISIFLEEGEDLISQLSARIRQWRTEPDNRDLGTACARLLHTLKGSARMAGAMRLGEHIHQIESWLESSRQVNCNIAALCDELETSLDAAAHHITGLKTPAAPAPVAERDSSSAIADFQPATAFETQDVLAAGLATLRIRADKVDAFVNQAGEIGISRTRIEGELRTLRGSLLDLTENVIRLRGQLREVELQAETQMQTRIAQAESAHSEFDPLEMDRYTRLQELTRMMAESVGDVTTVQHNLLRNLDGAEIALNSQARMARELQQSLMQVRMVPFDSIADRLHRIVRQSAKDLGKRANLDLRGGRIEIDRGVLETMVAPLEHLLRNAVAHGIESPEQRQTAGKSPIGQITLSVRQEGNEVGITLTDDGTGLNLERIAERASSQGLLSDEELKDPGKLANMIFVPGFTTAGALSSLSGRGIGMDVVKADTASVGGRVDVSSQPGSGTEFRINLPLTLAATQALLVRAAGVRHAIPSNLIAQVMEVKSAVLERIVKDGGVMWQDTFYPYTYLPWMIDENDARPEATRLVWLLLLRSGDRTLALHVDSLHGNQEVVVKNAGPQLMRIIGVSGVTLLADGEIVLILNPIALSLRPQVNLTGAPLVSSSHTPAVPAVTVKSIPTVMVVDDSLTVRKIASRLLEREGYRVISAKDGVDALEHLLDEVPDVILSDIEMPRMDGFELLRNIRADERTANTPVIMITSRLADKHREYAMKLGASHYLGKPYDEDELVGLLASMTGRTH